MTLENVFFKDQICDAKWTKNLMKCCKGSIKLTGNKEQDFWAYRNLCKNSKYDKIHIIDRQELIGQFESFIENVEKVMEE